MRLPTRAWHGDLRSHWLDLMVRAIAATVERDHDSDSSPLNSELKRNGATTLVDTQARESDSTFNSGHRAAKAQKMSKKKSMGNPVGS